jgi:superfamily I DNA/RNA helicase
MAEDKFLDVAKVPAGPTLLLAGPGTGKTHQLARRVKFLIEEGHVNPDNITVITFTGEAARNMRERLSDDKLPEVYVSPDQQPANIRTMHSLGYKIVTDGYRKLGLRKGFAVLPERVRKLLLEDSARILGFPGGDAHLTEECRRHGNCEESEKDKKCRICKQYRDLLRGLNAIDYDDQIFLARELLEQDHQLLSGWQQATRHLLVDEYQDINRAQYEFIRLLCRGQEEGLFVVGDDDQSIYSWRGGSPTYTVDFARHFGDNARVYTLNECRRCPPHFLKAALAVVSRDNPGRFCKDGLQSIRETDSTKVSLFEVPSDKYEANMICSAISKAPVTQDALVLVPGHRFAIPIKREMRRRRIPYDCRTNVVETGLNTLNDLLNWLKNPEESFSLRLCLEQIVTNPRLGIPFTNLGGVKEKREGTLAKMAALWPRVIAERITLHASLREDVRGNDDLAFIETCLTEIRNAWDNEESEGTGAFLEAVSRVLRPWASIKRMSQEIEDWVEDALAKNVSAGEAVARVLTMEAAKGLASDQVFVVGLNKGIFPPDDLSADDLREKQRLLYVSMTRAKRRLQMFSARTREGRFSYQAAPDGRERGTLKPSPMLEWLPDEDVEFEQKWPHK